MIKKLQIKFIGVLMTVITIMLAAILIVVINFTAKSMRRQSMDMMNSLSSTQMDRIHPGRPDDRARLPYFTVQIGQHSEIIAHGNGFFDLSDEEYILEIVTAALSANGDNGELRKYGLRFLKTNTPAGCVIVFSDMQMERITLRNMLLTSIAIFAVAEILFLGISILLSRWVIKPVEKAFNQQRQFVSDASHELKTPLAVIMANAELMQSEETPDEDKKKFAGSILSTTYQMRSLVENMLEMARVDSGGVRMHFSTLDVSELVADAVLSFQLLYEEKGMGLCCEAAEGLHISGSEQHLYQVMDVLLDNALKYSTPGSEVRVELVSQGRNCILSVASPGEPIPGEELKNIFKRFYRADKARAMNGSYGLGLSIAESIVQAHKGKIWAQSGSGCNTFFVQLPRI